MNRIVNRLALAALLALTAASAGAADANVRLTLKDHVFDPKEPSAPAGQALTIEIVNADGAAAEFESAELKVEKVVPANGKASVHVRALSPGRYRFFDDYHEASAEGFLVVK